MTNKEKFLLLVSEEPSETMDLIKHRIANREKLREKFKQELEQLKKEDMKNRKQMIKDLVFAQAVYLFGVGAGCGWKARTMIIASVATFLAMLIAAFIDYLIIVFSKKDDEQR